MKKSEPKPKSSKATPTKPVASSAKKSLKPDPKKAIKPIQKPKPASATPSKTQNSKQDPKTIKKAGTSAPAKPAPNPAPVAKTKAAKEKKPSRKPQKLIQVVPTHKPAHVISMPAKREKMLMRFGKPAKRVFYKVDFLLKASPTIVYHFITNPAALVRWFCDAVDITGEFYTFSWKGNTEVAELIDDIEDERLRFRWLDGEDEEEFFEFRLSIADITDETILDIYDFAWADEVEDQKQLWRTQVERLRKETGDQ
jgi:uncharacterized protein YndB with AHSA1/START domain